MLIDFKKLKNIANEISNKFDHKVLNEIDYFNEINPTAENIAIYFSFELKKRLPELEINLIQVFETNDYAATYVPARNSIFLSIAAAWAEVQNIEDIFIGVNMLDYSGYPDCRNTFIKSMEKSLTLGTKLADLNRKFKIHTPLSDLKKFEIIRLGINLDVDYSLTSSCYNPDKKGRACGKCDSCKLRLQGFKAIGISDPISYII